jgi:prevent-host-death family protein
MNDVGVRELRQNLSVYLRRVRLGETLRVTERGRPVAVLGPLGTEGDEIARLVAAGRARPATLDLLETEPLPGPGLGDALEDVRGDRLV